MSLDIIPDEKIKKYDLRKIAVNGWAYMEIRKGMPGLKQAGKIAHDRLKIHLEKYGYRQCRHTPSLWKHIIRPISFTLVVGNFGVKYVAKQRLEHLINTLLDQYKIMVDLTVNSYLGLTIDWNYAQGYVDISMPDYVRKALQKFQHPALKRPTHLLSKWTASSYGSRIQYAKPPDTSPSLNANSITHIQRVVRKLQYYSLAIDNTALITLGVLGNKQTRSTKTTITEVMHLLDYMGTHPDAKFRF